MNEFGDQVVLVTGAAQGIGAAVARHFADSGARVALLDRSGAVRDAAATLAVGGAATLPLQADVRDGAVLEWAVELAETQLGPIDILVHAAGVLRTGDALEMNEDDWQLTLDTNAGGLWRSCAAVARRMRPRRRGTIVAIGSNAAAVPRVGMAAYAASKAAAAHMMRCLALELAPHGIRCNMVSPGSTDTPMQRQLWRGPESEAEVIRGTLDSWRLGIPLGRIADPQDIVEAVAFLASSRARHITMHDLRVDGGATLGA
ncbi:2,3-dihydro-2,3-dihydroxybenzoate dehydrogenase [Aquabacterium sp. A7-Y]|uniref:2,3-dihydro-2,3-dihydroxybenzoate dehydrogenase n=1 Tax=Aquabacterium sp. A7-Y TaxID=1349605 RepID=UPI00223E66A5|nr:2,3-dihydro-2,3-dihydroxybenzoate dehydrogenase [Aquabacterium sp. A7-Y]MCW7539443.1 2,3-dihydro-2,3-dihydroxybenzoate dehydrogenase [Aquabacterium sp. A7-Y]